MAHAAALLQTQESLGEAVTMYKKEMTSSRNPTPLMTPFAPSFARFISSLHETVLLLQKSTVSQKECDEDQTDIVPFSGSIKVEVPPLWPQRGLIRYDG